MNCFEKAPEFIEEDNRRFRLKNPISKQQMLHKHEALLPAELLYGKSVLDLGCCMGATGHWCLSHGANHYTGIECQSEYAQNAERLLGKYHPGKFDIHHTSIEEWLSRTPPSSYDITCLMGVIYAFVDYFSILKLSTAMTRSIFVIENMYSKLAKSREKFCGVQFINDQTINLASQNGSMVGRGTRISPLGMEWLMQEFGFVSKEGMIFPAPIHDIPDVYNRSPKQSVDGKSVRYLMRFTRVETPLKSLSENLRTGIGKKETWNT